MLRILEELNLHASDDFKAAVRVFSFDQDFATVRLVEDLRVHRLLRVPHLLLHLHLWIHIHLLLAHMADWERLIRLLIVIWVVVWHRHWHWILNALILWRLISVVHPAVLVVWRTVL